MIFTDFPGPELVESSVTWAMVLNTNIGSTSGSITTLSVTRNVAWRIGKIMLLYLDFTVTTNGTGSGEIYITLPSTAKHRPVFLGREIALTGLNVFAVSNTSKDIMYLTTNTGTYPGANGRRFCVNGSYEV